MDFLDFPSWTTLSSFFARVAYTAFLLIASFLLLREAFRVWSAEPLTLGELTYIDAGVVNKENAKGLVPQIVDRRNALKDVVMRLVTSEQEALQVSGLEALQGSGNGSSALPDIFDPRVSGVPELDELKSAANTVPKIELTIQGTDFGSLLTSLQRWIVPVNALKVSVFKRGEHFSFSLDWPNEDRAFAAKYAVSAFRNDVLEEAKLGASIGCRILWLELAEKSPSIAEIHPDVFCRWAEALSLFESGETARSGGSSDEIVSKRNKQALELLGKLPTTVENFPPLQNLFALLIEASGKPKTEIDHAWNNLSRVMAGEPPEPYLPPQVVATVTVDDSVTGAGRLVAVELPKGAFNRVTAAAVVRDQSNKRFLVLPDYAFNSDAPVGVWVADGLAGTVSQRIGSFYRKLSKHGIALVALEAETSASNRVMNGVLQSIGSVNIGDEVSLLSAVRGNARTAKVATIHLVGNSSRIVTDRQISRPGDGGAPVVDSDGNLVAMGYVGNPKEDLSEFIALQPVFKELGLSLAD